MKKAAKYGMKYLDNIKFANCKLNESTHDYYNRQPSSKLPAISYNALPGRGKSYFGKYQYSNLYEYRVADDMKIVYDPDQNAPDKSLWELFLEKKERNLYLIGTICVLN